MRHEICFLPFGSLASRSSATFLARAWSPQRHGACVETVARGRTLQTSRFHGGPRRRSVAHDFHGCWDCASAANCIELEIETLDVLWTHQNDQTCPSRQSGELP